MSRGVQRDSGRAWAGKWTALRPDTVPTVVAEVNDFALLFEEYKKACDDHAATHDGLGPLERRMQQMLRSAQLRLDVMTHFYEAHKKDARSDRIKVAVRKLKGLLAQEGVEEDPFSPQAAYGPHSLAAREDSASPVRSIRRTGTRSPRGRSARGQDGSPGKDAGGGGGGGAGRDPENAALKKQHEELLRARTLQKDGEIRNLNSLAGELTSKMQGIEQENLKLERAMLEMCEGRERMKSIVEEQVYTVTLMTKVSSLLHFEMRRILFKTVARGILFWCSSAVLLLHTVVTGGVHALTWYMMFRSQFDETLGVWSMLLVDLGVVSVVLGLLHEWLLFAEYDVHHGSIHWLVESVLMRRDDAVEAARAAAQRYAQQVVNAEYIDLSAYQRTSAKHKADADARTVATSAYDKSETHMSRRSATDVASNYSSPSHAP